MQPLFSSRPHRRAPIRPLRRIGLQQMNQLQQAALLVGALPCARLERCEDGADLWENGRGGCWRKAADAARPDAE